jgi:hypothetical protein
MSYDESVHWVDSPVAAPDSQQRGDQRPVDRPTADVMKPHDADWVAARETDHLGSDTSSSQWYYRGAIEGDIST